MIYKKLCMLFACFYGITAPLYSTQDQSEVKEAIRNAGRRALPGWLKGRGLPALAGAAMVVVPVTLVTGGFMAGIANAGAYDPVVDCASVTALVIGSATSVFIPVGVLLLKRQAFLTLRDLWLFNKFTSSTARLNTESLPSVKDISSMNSHHQLLTLTRDYFKTDGNLFERLTVSVPLFKGYNPTK